MWSSHPNAFLPDEDRHIYEEGVRRSGFLLIADVDDDAVDEAVRILNESHMRTVDIAQRSSQWRSEGWTPPAVGTGMAGMAGMSSGRQHSMSMSSQSGHYRGHFQNNYGSSGGSYDDYAPAYMYGTQMRGDSRYAGRQWNAVESDLRTDWESRNTGNGSTWEKMKAAVRHGWDRMTGDDGPHRS